MPLPGLWIPKFLLSIYWTSFYLLNAFYFWSVTIFILHFPNNNPNSFSIFINLIALYFLLLYLSIQLTHTPKPIPPPILHPPMNSFISKSHHPLSSKSSSFDSFFSSSSSSSFSFSFSSPSLSTNLILPSTYPSSLHSSGPSALSPSSLITNPSNTTTTTNANLPHLDSNPTLSEQLIIQKLEGLTLDEKTQYFNSIYPSPPSLPSTPLFYSKFSSLPPPPPPSPFDLNKKSNVSTFFIYQCFLTFSLMYCFYPVFYHPSFFSTQSLHHFFPPFFFQWCPFDICSTLIKRFFLI